MTDWRYRVHLEVTGTVTTAGHSLEKEVAAAAARAEAYDLIDQGNYGRITEWIEVLPREESE